MRFSIIIPLHRPTAAFQKCLTECLAVDHADFEIIIVSDRRYPIPEEPRIRQVLTGSESDTSPAEKRDLASEVATGEVLAFIDDDAYPSRNWLRTAEEAFVQPNVSAIGGPGITPPNSSLRARVGGSIYESFLGSGPLRYRFTPLPRRTVDDYPAYNLMVRREALARCGGWGTTYYGGEDTHLCAALASIDVRISYQPDLIVYHHRRPVFVPHIKQVYNVGVHRGYFMRTGQATSRRVMFLLPLLPPAALLRMLLRRKTPNRTAAYLTGAGALIVAASAPGSGVLARLLFAPALIAHHTAYSAGMLRGLTTRSIDR